MSGFKMLLGGLSGLVMCTTANAQTVVELEAERDNGEIVAGDLSLPDGEGRVPAVVLISGSGRQDRTATVPMFAGYRNHLEWTEHLNDAGFAVIRFDEPGSGGSEGDWAQTGLYEMKDAVAAILDEAAVHDRVDAGRIFVQGHSEGSIIAMLLSAERADLAGLVLLAAPGQPMWEIIEYQNREQALAHSEDPAEQEARMDELNAELLTMMRRYATVRESTQVDSLSAARMVQSPTLIVHGTADYQIPVSGVEGLRATIEAAGQQVEAVIVADVNHLLVTDPDRRVDYAEIEDLSLDREVVRSVVDWLTKQAGPQ